MLGVGHSQLSVDLGFAELDTREFSVWFTANATSLMTLSQPTPAEVDTRNGRDDQEVAQNANNQHVYGRYTLSAVCALTINASNPLVHVVASALAVPPPPPC